MAENNGPFLDYAAYLAGYADEGERRKLMSSTGRDRVIFDARLKSFETEARAAISSERAGALVPRIIWVVSRLVNLPDTETGIVLLRECEAFFQKGAAGLSWESAYADAAWEAAMAPHEREFIPAEARALCDEAVLHFAIVTQTLLVKIHSRLFEYGVAAEAGQRAIDLAEREERYAWLFRLVGNRSNVLMYAGEWERAEASFSRTLTLAKLLGERENLEIPSNQKFYAVHNNFSFLYLLWVRKLMNKYAGAKIPRDVLVSVENKIHAARMHAEMAINCATELNDVESLIRSRNNFLEAMLRQNEIALAERPSDFSSLEIVVSKYEDFVRQYRKTNAKEFNANAPDVYGNLAEAYAAANRHERSFSAAIFGMQASTLEYDLLNERESATRMKRLLFLYREPFVAFIRETLEEDFGTGREAGRRFWLRINQNPVVAALAGFMQAKDPNHGGGHPRRMMRLFSELYVIWKRKGGADFSFVETLWSIFVHDIGKMEVSQMILGKVGPLSDREFEKARGHVVATERICADLGLMFLDGKPWIGTHAAQHHENLLGTGYPRGITDMTFIAQCVAIVDGIESATSRRSYVTASNGGLKETRGQKVARLISEFSSYAKQGKFDPLLAECAVSLLGTMEPD